VPSINEASAVFKSLVNEGYAEGLHDGLRVAMDVVARAQEEGASPTVWLRSVLTYFEDHRP